MCCYYDHKYVAAGTFPHANKAGISVSFQNPGSPNVASVTFTTPRFGSFSTRLAHYNNVSSDLL